MECTAPAFPRHRRSSPTLGGYACNLLISRKRSVVGLKIISFRNYTIYHCKKIIFFSFLINLIMQLEFDQKSNGNFKFSIFSRFWKTYYYCAFVTSSKRGCDVDALLGGKIVQQSGTFSGANVQREQSFPRAMCHPADDEHCALILLPPHLLHRVPFPRDSFSSVCRDSN